MEESMYVVGTLPNDATLYLHLSSRSVDYARYTVGLVIENVFQHRPFNRRSRLETLREKV